MDLYDNSPGRNFSEAKLQWLDGELKKAAADDPTGTKPIFVYQHMVDNHIGNVLKKYPQVINFAGHSHRAMTDPLTIQQDNGYTSVNTASLAYLGIPLAGQNKSVVAMNNNGGWDTGDIERSVRNGGMFYIMEISTKNEVRLLMYNIYSQEVHTVFELGKLGNPSTYTYTQSRKLNVAAPTFAKGATGSVVTAGKSGFTLRIPQASSSDTVSNYRCEVYNGIQLVATTYRLSCQYLGSAAPEYITAPFTGLSPNTTYTVKIYPVGSWGKEGAPLTVVAKTAASSANPVADIFSLSINTAGAVMNVSDGTLLNQIGDATVITDSALNRKVISVNGNGCYTADCISDYYGHMADGFTFETYFYLDSKDTGSAGYLDTVSNQEAGGFGFELKADGKLYFMCNSGNGYDRAGATVKAGEWVHAVGVYDGSKVHIYINGALKASADVTGSAFKIPNHDSRYLCVGGDSASGRRGLSYMDGKIATVNIYSEVLSGAEILALYNKVK
jgi:hypothetical protein